MLRRVLPLPIQIEPTDVRTIVAMDDSIRVHHGNYLKDEILSQFFSLIGIGKQKLQNPIAYEGRNRFARVDSSSDYNIAFIEFLRGVVFGYGEDIDSVASDSLAQWCSNAKISEIGISLNLFYHLVEVGVSEGITVGKINFILGMGKRVLPG